MSFKVKNGANVGYTTTERDDFSSGWGTDQKGTVIINKSSNEVQFWNGSGWTALTTGGASVDTQNFLVNTLTIAPVGAWPLASEFPLNEAVDITPFTSGTGWTEKEVDLSIVSGSLPSGITLVTDQASADYSKIIGTATTILTGSCTIRCSNPRGDFDYVLNWSVQQPNGVSQFTNSESLYPILRITTSNSIDTQLFTKTSFSGRTTATSNGVMIADSSYPIWSANNNDGTWNYLCYPTGYSYWNFYKNIPTNPSDLADGVDSLIKTTGNTYDLVAPTSNNITVSGVNYPSDRSDVHYGTLQNYIDFGVDASLDNFMTDAGNWSYGFRLQQDIPKDGLGRVMFAREGRNWTGLAIGHNDIYSEMLYGNGSSRSYDSSEVTSIPAGGFTSGSFVRCTMSSGTFSIYVDGVKYYDYSITTYMDGTSANSLSLLFGKGVESNDYQSNASYYHGYWQGLIDRLWVSNGVVETTDDDGNTFPAGVTHSWLLDEATGSTFTANTGGVNGEGRKTT